MGTTFYCACHDCALWIDLDKFYGWAPGEGIADLDRENLDEFGHGWIYRSLRLHFFMREHNGHRLAVLTEHDFDDCHPPGKEVFPWPHQGDTATDTVDFTDPKAGRLLVSTRYGDIILDVRKDGVNCFRFVGGKRQDTLLLPAQDG